MEEKSTTRICVPVCVNRADEIGSALVRAMEFGDLVELRLDCLNDVDLYKTQNEITGILRNSSRPVVFTLRPAEQGGHRELSFSTRITYGLSLLRGLSRNGMYYVDVEVDIGQFLTSAEKYLIPIPWERMICSHHDFDEVPADLDEIYERMIATRAHILKIAVQANDITDCVPVLRLLERARSKGREMIAIAMGEAGLVTRILGPSRGAYLTYGSLDAEQATAPGQIKASVLREMYRIHSIDQQTEIMGLVGRPVSHSVSPQIHNAAFAEANLNAVYIPFEVSALDDFVRRMVRPLTRELEWNLVGLSITAPHKTAIMNHMDWIDPPALEIGAVNTVVIAGDGLYGYNTDASAVLSPLNGLVDLDGKCVAVIGAGGAARSLLWSLRKERARVTVFARDVERARETATKFGAECENLNGAFFGEFEIVVNATPLGTRGQNENATPALADQLRGAMIAYDLVYNPTETRFIREALGAGCQTIGGLQMLVAQAAEQFRLWHDRDAPLKVMRDAALTALDT